MFMSICVVLLRVCIIVVCFLGLNLILLFCKKEVLFIRFLEVDCGVR